MQSVSKLLWYGAAMAFPLVLQSTLVGHYVAPGAGPPFYAAVSLLLTMIQVGQGAVFQVLLARGDRVRFGGYLGTLLFSFICAAFAVNVFAEEGTILATTSIAVLGLVTGSAFSMENAHLLKSGTEIRYFKRLFFRNLAVMVACILLWHLVGREVKAVAFTGCGLGLLALWHATNWRASAWSDGITWNEGVSSVAGVMATSLYRNDQNLVRSFSITSASFTSVHNGLLAGMAIQSIVGAAMTTQLLPRMRSGALSRGAATRLECLALFAISVIMLTSMLIPLVFAKAMLASAILAINQWWSYKLHAKSRSLVVYIAGAASFLVLFALLATGVEPVSAYLVYAIVTCIAVAGLEVAIR